MKCINCGNELNNNMEFCPNCGSKITLPNKENKRIIIAGIFIIVLIGVLGVILGIRILKNNNISGNNNSNIKENSNIIEVFYDKNGNLRLANGTVKKFYTSDSQFKETEDYNIQKLSDNVIIYDGMENIMGKIYFISLCAHNENNDKAFRSDKSTIIDNVGNIDLSGSIRSKEMYKEKDLKNIVENRHLIDQKTDQEPTEIEKIDNNKYYYRLNRGANDGKYEYIYYLNIDDNNYYIASLYCYDGETGCSAEQDTIDDILKTLNKIEFKVKK